jgi:hypothetical protein
MIRAFPDTSLHGFAPHFDTALYRGFTQLYDYMVLHRGFTRLFSVYTASWALHRGSVGAAWLLKGRGLGCTGAGARDGILVAHLRHGESRACESERA